jgi:glutathione S-transferase
MTTPGRLITLLPSADVDLARWLLARWGVPFREEPHAPVFHLLALKRAGAGRMDSPLFLRGDARFAGVEALVDGLDRHALEQVRVLPDPNSDAGLHAAVMALQHDLRWTMGMGTVRWAYHHFLRDRALVWDSFTTGVPGWERLALRAGAFGPVRNRLISALGLSDAAAAEALDTVRTGFDRVEALLADGRRYLCGDRLTLADLAFATSGAPMVLASGYGGHLPAYEACPPDIRAVVTALRARPAGRFIQRLYDEERAGSAASSGSSGA